MKHSTDKLSINKFMAEDILFQNLMIKKSIRKIAYKLIYAC